MKPNACNYLSLLMIGVSFPLLAGCESGSGFVNSAPSELKLTARKCFVETGGTITLLGAAHDEDGDSLTFSWTAPSGSFALKSSAGDTVTWKAPNETGPVPITMNVSDGVESSSMKQEITVCEQLFPNPPVTVSTIIQDLGAVYILKSTSSLRIPSNVTLTIEPGVRIVMDSEFGGFEIYGTLIAKGTPGNRIRMQGNTCTTSLGLWRGIYVVEPVGRGVFENVDITMSSDGIQVSDSASASIDSCNIYYNDDYGVSAQGAGTRVDIRSCLVWENGAGIYIRNAEASIKSSSIRYSSGNGIEVSFSAGETHVEIESCTVANNGVNGIQLTESAAPEIHYCSIFSNGENAEEPDYGLKLASYISSDSVHAENNFWGLGNTTPARISAVIYDASDNPSQASAYVRFIPWLNTSPMRTSAPECSAKGRAWARLSR